MAANFGSVKWSAIALVGTVAKVVFKIKAPSTIKVRLHELEVSFDGATSTDKPVLVEQFFSDEVGAGTPASTPSFVNNDQSQTLAFQTTAGVDYSAGAPTNLTVFRAEYLGQFNGSKHYIVPFNSPIIVNAGKGYGIRCTSPNNVNCAGFGGIEE